MKLLGRILNTLGILILAFAVLAGLLGGQTLTRSFPQTSGTLKVPGLQAVVQIIRDANGVPHLYADNPHDLFMAQGYVHAQDRFFQMDFWRHTTSGRISELVGESQVETDEFLRTVGWARVAEFEYAAADSDIKAVLDAYTEGVNAYIGSRSGADLSLEYPLLGLVGLRDYKPEPWTPVNSLAWAKAMAWDLGGNLDDEIMRTVLLQHIGLEKTADYMPTFPSAHPVIVPSPAIGQLKLDDVRAQIEKVNAVLGGKFRGIGSNNWVIAGSRTTTGMPLLANDPHLSIQMPAIWYLVGLHCRTLSEECPYDVVGYSLAGDPGVILGHNNRIAWGATNVNPDVQDLFIEKINPANPNQYEINGQWVEMAVREEVINVLGGEPVKITVRYTRNGPIIGEVYDDAQRMVEGGTSLHGAALNKNYALALRWTALEPGKTFRAVLAINRAQNWQEFRNALRDWTVPSQNFVYADVEGNIGYQMPSLVPIRKTGNGTLPAPGWTDDYQWTGYIPFDELPYAFNPPQGYVATANQPVVGPDYKYLITATGFDMGYRAARINALIQAEPKISADDIAKIQGDNMNLGARDILPYLLALNFDSDPKELQEAVEALKAWDFQMGMDSQPAAIYAAFLRALVNAVLANQLPEDYPPSGGDNNWVTLSNLLANPQSSWWSAAGSRDEALRRALAEGYKDSESRLGPEPANWRWGRLHGATFNNRVFGSAAWPAPIRALFNRGPFPASGGASVVNATSYNFTRPDPYAVTSVPSMRMIIDLSNFDNARMIHTTGQSGHAFHAHYIDMADKWRKIEYNPMPFSPAAVQQAGVEVLRLEP